MIGQYQPAIVNRSGVKRLIGAAPGSYASPRVSPDGKQIVYAAGQGMNGSELLGADIWGMDLATGQAVRVTTNLSGDHPVWSREGTELYFSRSVVDQNELRGGSDRGRTTNQMMAAQVTTSPTATSFFSRHNPIPPRRDRCPSWYAPTGHRRL